MPTAIINGRRVNVPTSTSDQEIRQTGQIEPQRNLIRRTREGNYLVPQGSHVHVEEGDIFLDAPARVKGAPFDQEGAPGRSPSRHSQEEVEPLWSD